jgi:DNA replication and repair protein RecF
LIVTTVTLRDFRGYERATAPVGSGLTVITGPNGAGKTNLLEALYFGCTGRSCRTGNDRELVRFGAAATRVAVETAGADGLHQLTVAFVPGEAKRMTVDGAPVERLLDSSLRPLVSVFLPDRLELIKGVPAGRRAHLDQFVAAVWPSRALTRRTFAQALAQRNALLTRINHGSAGRDSLRTWDVQLATHALALMADRRAAVEALEPAYREIAERLGLDGEPTVAYRPRSHAVTAEAFVSELADRLQADLERGHTAHGPHRDDLALRRHDRELKTYGSQGQQRLGLLALLLAERQVIAARRDGAPVMLLDDVMSELDARRRGALVELLRESAGQAVITATDLDHIPGADSPGTTRIVVQSGQLHPEPSTAAAL